MIAAARPRRPGEEQIRKFLSRDYWEVHATFLAEAGEYQEVAEAVAAGGGEAGVDGRHKEGDKAETTAATAYPTAISASSMKPRTKAYRRNR